MTLPKTAVSDPEYPMWQRVIDALRESNHLAEAHYMEDLRDGAKDPKVTTEQLAKLIGKLE